MDVFAIVVFVLLALAALFVWGLFIGAPRGTRHQRIVFYSGLTGLLAIPLWVAGVAGLMMQFLLATLDSPSGYMAITASVMLLGAVIGTLVAASAIGRGEARISSSR